MTTDLKGRINQVWIAVGLICAVAAFGLAYYFTRSSNNASGPTVPANGQLVVVARVSIPSGTLITSSMLEETRIKGLLPQNAYTTCEQLVGGACSATVGVSSTRSGSSPLTSDYYAAVPISANTVLTSNLVSLSKSTQSPTVGAPNVPPGDVAIAVPLSAQEAVAGYLQAGDRIDFIVTASNGSTNFAFEDIPVIGVGAPGSTSTSSGGGLVVLECTRSQALGIEELVKSGAIYNVALRSSSDFGHGYIPTTTSAADGYTQACSSGSKVNPIIQTDLQEAQQEVKQATASYNTAQHQYNKDNNTLQNLPSNSKNVQAAKQQVLTDAATLAQDQFSLIQAQNAVSSDQAVLYCGAQAATSQSGQAGNYSSGSGSMMQSLFGFSLAGSGS